MTEPERLAEAEKLRQRMLQQADKSEQLARLEKKPAAVQELTLRARRMRADAAVVDSDPKQGGRYFNRIHGVDAKKLVDLDEESPLGPMRNTDRISRDGRQYGLCEGVNVFTIKISSSDIGFPIHVYGTVIARDCIDLKCIYLFRCDRNCCQLVNSEDDSLILTGPKRGIALIDDNDGYLEIDLKVKNDGGQDRELSKGYNGHEDDEFCFLGTNMHVEVTWSTMSADYMTELQHLAEVEKLRQEMLQKADQLEQLARQEKDLKKAQDLASVAQSNRDLVRIVDFDPKQGGCYYNRIYYLPKFDLDEESSIGPMRYTDRINNGGHQYTLCDGVNIFTVKIASSDIGYPIHVYGTVTARDNIEHKCIYLFRRDRNCCQLINVEDDSLTLTAPT